MSENLNGGLKIIKWMMTKPHFQSSKTMEYRPQMDNDQVALKGVYRLGLIVCYCYCLFLHSAGMGYFHASFRRPHVRLLLEGGRVLR